VAQGLVNRLVPATALSLGVVRAVVHGTFLVAVLTTSFSALGQLPVTILRPTGIMKLLPWNFYDRLLTPSGMSALKLMMVVVLLFGCLGFFTSVSSKLSLLFVLFYQGLVRSFGHFNHDEMIAIYYLAVLAFTPCADAFSLDELIRKRPKSRPGFVYSYPMLLMWLLMGWVYFSSALIKLRVAGFKYLAADNLPALAIFHSLDNLHDTQFKLAFMLPQFRSVLPFVVGVVLLWELVFPFAVFVRKLRWWILGFGVLFHVATLFLMNIFFPYQLAMYLVFVDWDRVAERVKRLRSTEVT
jgi:hypothetical protein